MGARADGGGTADGEPRRAQGRGETPYQGITGMTPTAEAEMFRSVATSSRNAVLAADAEGYLLWANEAAERMLGWPLADLVGRPLTELLPEEERAQAYAARRRVMRGEQVPAWVTGALRKDGEVVPVTLTPAVRRDPAGTVLGLSVILSDVTEELRVRAELTEALARSHARFDQVATPQALLDLRARFVAVNDAACHLLGQPREALLGREATELVSPVDLPGTGHRLDLLRRGRVDSVSYEVTASRGDGVEVPLLIDASVVRDRAGTPREIAVFARDLSDIHEAQRRLEDQDALFKALYRRAADVVVVTDADDRISYVSPSLTHVLGFRPEQVLGTVGQMFVHPDDVASSRAHAERLRARPGRSERRLARARDAGGGWRWFDVVTTNCLDDPAIAGMVSNLRDVTTEIEALERLRESEGRYRAIVETAQEGILALARDGRVLFANDKLAELMGVGLEDVYTRGMRDLLAPEEARRMEARLGGREAAGPEHYEVGYDHPDGSRRTWLVAASPLFHDDGSPMGSLGMVSDVTAARQAEAELRHQALHDSLTGLPNRALLVDRLAMASARQHRDHSHGLAVMFLDLDHFKLVNDSRGHDAGDRLLVEVAGRLERAVRETDTVARLGGDEFAVICEDAGEDEAVLVAARIQRALEEPVDLGDEQVYVSVSIGIAQSPPHDVSDLLRFADAAMYDAKLGGRSQVQVFHGAEVGGAERRLAISAALRQVLAAGGPPLGYQPIVDFDRGVLTGLEALLRWSHPVLGEIEPPELLAAAETAGLSFDLDRAVISRAGADLVRLRAAGVVDDEVAVAVNISPRTARQQRLDDLVRAMLRETGLPASSLTLEITEHAIMDNAEHAVALLGRLTDSGVTVAIDDFGTGYHSLVHLHRLPVSELKIDRSFVEEIVTRAESRAIARSIVGLADALGLETVAEGIEDEAQVEVLRELGCHRGQGFLWGRATPVDELAAVLDRWRR